MVSQQNRPEKQTRANYVAWISFSSKKRNANKEKEKCSNRIGRPPRYVSVRNVLIFLAFSVNKFVKQGAGFIYVPQIEYLTVS